MIVVDTNVISELMRPEPTSNVLNWFAQHRLNSLFVTSVTLAEIRFGLHLMPDGKRKLGMTGTFEHYVQEAFDTLILDFTDSSAHIYAQIAGHSKEMGKTMSVADAQIASISELCVGNYCRQGSRSVEKGN